MVKYYRKCIYCDKLKPLDSFSFEHVIPQFLGGAQSPDCLKTHSVCKKCNNDLGLFVDAAFSKEFFVSKALAFQEYYLFDPNNKSALPYYCMGQADCDIIVNLENNECCEYWIGPFGEQMFWVRPNEERFYWYTGGNPIKKRKFETRAYFIFSEGAVKDIQLSLISMRELFKDHKIKKICCTKNDIKNISDFGFSKPDELDILRILGLPTIEWVKRGRGRVRRSGTLSRYGSVRRS